MVAHPADFDLVTLYDHMTHSLKISLSICTHPVGSVSLKNQRRVISREGIGSDGPFK